MLRMQECNERDFVAQEWMEWQRRHSFTANTGWDARIGQIEKILLEYAMQFHAYSRNHERDARVNARAFVEILESPRIIMGGDEIIPSPRLRQLAELAWRYKVAMPRSKRSGWTVNPWLDFQPEDVTARQIVGRYQLDEADASLIQLRAMGEDWEVLLRCTVAKPFEWAGAVKWSYHEWAPTLGVIHEWDRAPEWLICLRQEAEAKVKRLFGLRRDAAAAYEDIKDADDIGIGGVFGFVE